MRRILMVAVSALAVGGVAGARLARAFPGQDAFVLEKHDRIVAEAPGCYSSCEAMGDARRCTLREPECRPVCVSLPECKLEDRREMRVCMIVRDPKPQGP